jgi:hypothetical protein
MSRENIFNTLLSLVLLAILPIATSFGQKDDILRRLKADDVKSSVYLQILNDEVFYLHDVSKNNRNSAGFLLAEGQKPLWTSKSNKLRLSIGFYNPYQYSVKVTSDLTEDPISQTTEQFFTALTGMLNVITTGTPIAATVSPLNPGSMDMEAFNATVQTANGSNGPLTLDSVHLSKFRSPAIIEWSMWIQTDAARVCHMDPAQINTLVENIAKIEILLFQKFKVQDSTRTFNEHIKKIIKDLYEPTDVDSFAVNIKRSRTRNNDLKKEVAKAQSNLARIKSENGHFTISGTGFCNVFPLYHQMVFAQYLSEVDEKLKKLDKIRSTVDDLINVGDDFMNQNKVILFNGKQKEIIFNKELVVEDDKLNIVTLEVKHQEIDPNSPTTLKSKKEFKRSFEVTKFRRAWPEISSGIFYSGIEYNTFSVGTSTAPSGGGATTSVVEQTTTKQRFMAALFYNQIFDTGIHPMYPFLQIGVGTGKEYPCLLAGGGFRIINKDLKRISISGGWVFSFAKELDKLKVGDTITKGQSEIDADVRYRLGEKVGFYVGVAWKLN